MGFIMEFFGRMIRESMEDPDERDRKIREHIQQAKARADRLKEYWANPVKPDGFWTSDRYTHKYFFNLEQSREQGRNDPYDQLP